jgi:hypothetical protein
MTYLSTQIEVCSRSFLVNSSQRASSGSSLQGAIWQLYLTEQGNMENPRDGKQWFTDQ